MGQGVNLLEQICPRGTIGMLLRHKAGREQFTEPNSPMMSLTTRGAFKQTVFTVPYVNTAVSQMHMFSFSNMVTVQSVAGNVL